MKLVKEIIVTHEEFNSSKKMDSVDAFVKSNRYEVDLFELFFEVREDDESVIFANLCGYERSHDELTAGEPKVVQVETAVLNKKTKEMVRLVDNQGLDDYDGLSKFPVWKREELESIGAHGFRDEKNGEFDETKNWDF